MKKYERKEEIWGLLENSILIDSDFISLSNEVTSFFIKLQKNDPIFFKECYELIKWPFRYLSKLERRKSIKIAPSDLS